MANDKKSEGSGADSKENKSGGVDRIQRPTPIPPSGQGSTQQRSGKIIDPTVSSDNLSNKKTWTSHDETPRVKSESSSRPEPLANSSEGQPIIHWLPAKPKK